MNWVMLHPRANRDMLGLIPEFLSESSDLKAAEQLHNAYSHGGGWMPFRGFQLNKDNTLSYPGDPPTIPIAMTKLRDETIIVYEHAWVAVIQPDRSFEVSRMD